MRPVWPRRLKPNLGDLNRWRRPPERRHISAAAAAAIYSGGSGDGDSSICSCSAPISAYRLPEFITLCERELKVRAIIDL